MPEKVIIIGSGPAAWAAAIYAARAALQPLVFEGAITEENRLAGTLPLGQLALTTEVENYPGFPAGDLTAYLDSSLAEDKRQFMAPHNKEGVSGPELMELMRQQAVNFGTRVITEDIVDVDFSAQPFRLTASDGNTYESHAVIVATGARANYLGLPSEEKYKNRGVSACAVCDGALPRFRNKPLAVIGGGDSAVEEADYLTKFASTVYMVHRRARASGVEDHGPAGRRQSEDRNPLEPHAGRSLGQRQGRRDRRPPAKHRRRARPGERRHRRVPGHRPHAQHGLPEGQAGADREEVHQVDHARPNVHERGGRFCRRRRGRRLLSPGRHRRRQRLHGRPGRRTLAGGQGILAVDSRRPHAYNDAKSRPFWRAVGPLFRGTFSCRCELSVRIWIAFGSLHIIGLAPAMAEQGTVSGSGMVTLRPKPTRLRVQVQFRSYGKMAEAA